MLDRDFKGVWIPREVWLDDKLTILEKGVLTEIDSLDMSNDGCWASNEYLAKFCQCSENKVSLAISKLTKLGYIRIESFDGRKRKIKSCLSFFQRQTLKKTKADFEKNKESNTPINPPINLENKTNTRKSDANEIPPDFERFWEVYPRKVSKNKAIPAWRALKPTPELVDTIVADVKLRVDTEWKGTEDRFIPHPSTYLNQRRWEDETRPKAWSGKNGQEQSVKDRDYGSGDDMEGFW